jgi:hypothetical protein
VDIWSLGIVFLQLALLLDLEALGALMWEAKMLSGALEKRKARVDTFVSMFVQPKVSAEFFGANLPMAQQVLLLLCFYFFHCTFFVCS